MNLQRHGNVYLAGDDQEVLDGTQVTKEVGTEQGYMAVADEVSMFHYWLLDDEEQTANPIEITFDADHTLEAVFGARPLYLLPAGGSDWPMLMHDSARTGKTTDIGPSSNELLWRYPAAGHIFGSPVVVDGVVYVGDSEGYVYAINATTNKEIWKYSIGHSITTTPCVANDVVYVCQGLDVYALKAETIDPNGELLWKYSIIDNWGQTVTPVVEDSVVYTAAGATVYALDATTTNKNGELLWQYANNYMGEGASTSAVIVGYDKIFIAAGPCIWITDLEGQLLEVYDTDTTMGSCMAIDDGLLFAGNNGGDIKAYPAETLDEGGAIWSYEVSHNTAARFSVADGVVYAGAGSYVVALDANTTNLNGEALWSCDTNDYVYGAPVYSNGKLYVGLENYYLVAFNAETENPHGEPLWAYLCETNMYAAPAISGGVLYSTSYDGSVYAFASNTQVNLH